VATDSSQVRSIAVTGQGGVGKTSLADALLFATGVVNRLGRVDEETSVFDTEPEETRRRCTITCGFHHGPWKKHELTFIDTPGQGNFVNETRFALRGAAGALFVVDAASPLRAEASKVWKWLGEDGLPTIVVLNRLDRDEADAEATVAALTEQLGAKLAVLQLPIKEGGVLTGVVDVLAGKAWRFDGDTGVASEGEVPAELADRVEELRMEITEAAAEGDDALLEKYLEEGELSAEDVQAGLRAAIASGELAPVLCASALANIGMPGVLDGIVELLPAPSACAPAAGTDAGGAEIEISPDPSAPVAAVVFKTIHDQHAGQLSVMRVVSGTLTADTAIVNTTNDGKERLGHLLRLEGKKSTEVPSATVGEVVAVAKLKATHFGDTLAEAGAPRAVTMPERPHGVISFALEAAKRGEEDKVMQGLHKLCEEDPALHVDRDEETGEILLSGAGQLHVETACERLERKYGAKVVLKAPKVPYRETIRKSAKAHGRLKKQTGGHGQFADCHIEIEPLPSGSGFEFADRIVGGSIPKSFIPAVEKGVVEAMKTGTIAGYPVVDVKVTVFDGQYHDVDSSEMAFKVAGSMAFKEGLAECKPVLLEPYVALEVSVPDECMGDVMGDLNQRRAKVEGMEQRGSGQCIKAKAPMNEVLRYQPDLTSITSGRGSFEMHFSHYEQAPQHVVDKVVAESKRED
jgi:elongation factor G